MTEPAPDRPDPAPRDPGDELVAVYDAAGRVTGSAQRRAVRAQGLWHACGSILVRSGDGERVHVHRRSEDKDVYPGMHDCWAGGVVAAGETPLECARRELAEELGITGVPLVPLFSMSMELPPVRVHLAAFEVRWDGPVVHQRSEIADGGWLTVAELRARLGDPGWPFVPDGRVAVERWFSGPAS